MVSQVSTSSRRDPAPAVLTRDLFRVYSTPEGDAAALQGLSMAVGEGEVLAVLGASGSGKSTLLRILAGLERPSAGTVHVFGLELAKLDTRRLDRYRSELLGYADQHYERALGATSSIREAIALPLGLRGVGRQGQLKRADELLERVGLLARRDAQADGALGRRAAAGRRLRSPRAPATALSRRRADRRARRGHGQAAVRAHRPAGA